MTRTYYTVLQLRIAIEADSRTEAKETVSEVFDEVNRSLPIGVRIESSREAAVKFVHL